MFSYLIVALFAVLAVSSRPVLPNTPSSTPTTDNCSDPTSSTPAVPSSSLTPSVTPTPATTSSQTVADASNGPFTGGFATYYYQNGNPGACGQINPDTAYICAMDQTRFGTLGPGSPLCGLQVQITNLNNGMTVTVTIADDCPTCTNGNSIDLSVAAFASLSDLSVGEFPISWSFV